MPPTPPLPTPPFSVTDVATALVTVVMIVLDVVTGYLGGPALDPVTRASLMGSLTVLAIAGLSAYVYNRGAKNKAAAAITVAAISAPASASPAPFTGGQFVITPIDGVPGEFVIRPPAPPKT